MTRVILWLAVANLWLLAGTAWAIALFRELPSLPEQWRPWVSVGLNQLNLATENVAAVWYSSMLLLLVAVGAAACFVADRGRPLRWGWLAVAAVFLLLSLDELGAVHERVGSLAALNPTGEGAPGWIYLLALPVALVGALLLAFGWAHARSCPGTAALFTVGTLLFLSVPLQEKLEVDLLWSAGMGAVDRPIALTLLEEGTELFGTLSFLAAVLLYARSRVTLEHLVPGRAWGSAYALGAVVMAVGLLLALVTSPARVAYSQDALWVGSFFNAALVGLDADLAAGLAAENVEIRIIPAPPGEMGAYRGRAALRGWIEQNQREGFRLRQHAVQPQGNAVVWRGQARRGDADLRTRTHVVVGNGKVQLLIIEFAPPVEEIAAAAENWFPSAAAALAALGVVALAWLGRSRAPTGAVAVLCLLLSLYYGANAAAYSDWGDFDALRRGLHELLSAAAIVTALVWVLRETDTLTRVCVVVWALGIGAALGMGGLYSAPLAFAAYVALAPALLGRGAAVSKKAEPARGDLRDAAMGDAVTA